MSGKTDTFLLLCMVAAVACLLYLDWWRQAELQDLDGRVVQLELERQRRQRSKPAAKKTPPEEKTA